MEGFEHTTLTAPCLYDPKLEELITPLSIERCYPSKYIFLHPGETMDYIYYLKSGRTRHYMDNNEGMVKLLYTLTPGWFFGETPYFTKMKTGLYSQTEGDVIIYKIPRRECDKLIRENELFRNKLYECFSLKMLILRYEIANLSFNSTQDRLKRLFCSLVELAPAPTSSPNWYDVKIHYTHQELGEIVGGTRVTISRQINKLCEEGFLRTLNRRFQVNKEEYSRHTNKNEDF